MLKFVSSFSGHRDWNDVFYVDDVHHFVHESEMAVIFSHDHHYTLTNILIILIILIRCYRIKYRCILYTINVQMGNP
jgi:hypothetical protein